MGLTEQKCRLAMIGCLMLGLALGDRVASLEAVQLVEEQTPVVIAPGDGSTQSPSARSPLVGQFVFFNAEDDASEDENTEDNLYLARKGLTPEELIEFILDMKDKPLSIQKRKGFSEAIIDAADRVLATKTEPPYLRIATLTKFTELHNKASFGDEEADEQLQKFVEQVKESKDERVAKEVAFLKLERKAINSDELSLDEVQVLLKELIDFFDTEKLGEKHLRMASSTVRAINRLDSDDPEKKDKYGDIRESYFTEFGNLFAKSDNKKLSAYGKKLAKPSGPSNSDLVGKPLVLTGATAEGAAFDWDAYRGKVVIVDFWATWCGPCVREMPNLKAFYEKNKDRGLDVVGVSLDKDLDALDTFIEQHKVVWETLAGDETKDLAKKYGVQGIPTMMLVDRKGNVVAVSHKIGDLSAQAEKLLAKPAAK